MWYYTIKKLLEFVLVLVGTILLLTTFISFAPGQDGFFFERFLNYFKMIITLDFGTSKWMSLPVGDVIFSRLGNTLILTTGAILINILIALPLGVYFGLRPNNNRTKTLSLIINTLSSVPILILGYLFIFLSASIFNFIPIFDQTTNPSTIKLLISLLLPMFVLAFGDGLTSDLVRHIREEVSRINKSPFMLAVRARDVSILRHLSKNTFLPIYSLFVSKISYLLGGAVVVEYIFNWKGFGYQTWNAAWTQDYNILIAASVVFVLIILLAEFSKELLTAIIHPMAGEEK